MGQFKSSTQFTVASLFTNLISTLASSAQILNVTLLEWAKNMRALLRLDNDMSCQQTVYFKAYFGLPVALWAYNAAETWEQQPAEGELQEGDVLPEEANSHQGEQTAVWENRQRPS